MRKKVIGLALIFVSLATLGFWELWGRENMTYEEILVFSNDVAKGTVITADMIKTKRVEDPDENAMRTKDWEGIVGLEAIQYVPKGTALYEEFFQDQAFSVGDEKGQYILSIPNEWLKSYPQTLRRGDKVYFYCDGEIVTWALVAYAKDSSNQEVNDLDDERLNATATVSLVEIIVDEEKALSLGRLADEGKRFVLLYS